MMDDDDKNVNHTTQKNPNLKNINYIKITATFFLKIVMHNSGKKVKYDRKQDCYSLQRLYRGQFLAQAKFLLCC